MERSLADVVKANNFSSSMLMLRLGTSSISFPTTYGPGIIVNPQFSSSNGNLRLKQPWQSKQLRKAVKCVKGGPVLSESEKRLNDEIIITEEELMGMGRLRDKCKEMGGGDGIAELLECLEREAIMGDDEGKEPNDYNRRAQIFDKSSRVFQALKESSSGPTNS